MKLSDLKEMTMKAGNLDYTLARYLPHYIKKIASFEHVGDIETIKVLKNSTTYLLMDGEDGVGYFDVEKIHEKRAELKVMFVVEKYRRQGITTKMIWFLKKHEGFDHIELSDVHSPDTIEVVKKLSAKFNVFWVKGDEKVKYDPATIDQYYAWNHPTGWKIILENDGDFSSWPRFYSPPDPRCLYDWLIE